MKGNFPGSPLSGTLSEHPSWEPFGGNPFPGTLNPSQKPLPRLLLGIREPLIRETALPTGREILVFCWFFGIDVGRYPFLAGTCCKSGHVF